MRTTALLGSLLALPSLLGACDDGGGGDGNENEVITAVTLTLTPGGGGAAVTAVFNDPDGDGGAAPTIDPIVLAVGKTYNGVVTFENRLEAPAEDITLEVADESDEHQIFYTGTAVNGPASNRPGAPLTQAYLDQDRNGLPIGLASAFTTAAGTGQLTITLRHMPPLNNVAVKTAGASTAVRDAAGFSTLGGSSDAQVTFNVTVQ
jgi:hypothetical protein